MTTTNSSIVIPYELSSQIDPNTIKSIIKRVRPKYFHFIGSGKCAYVWQIDKNRVFKLTTDWRDAKMSILLRRCGLIWAPKFFDVFSFPRSKRKNFYCIISEFVPKSLQDHHLCNEFDEMLANFYKKDFILVAVTRFNKKLYNWGSNVWKWFKTMKIRWDDAHIGNIRQRKNGEIVIVDFGFTYGKKIQSIKVPKLSINV